MTFFAGKAVGYHDGHFVYEAGRAGKCSRCATGFGVGDQIRVAGDLDDNGWWHDACPGREWVTKGTRVRHGDWVHADHIEGECEEVAPASMGSETPR